jgi:TolB-like protein
MNPRHLALLPLSLLAACGGGRRTYHDSNMDFGSVKTVAVMPFANLTRDPSAADRVRDVFANSLLASGIVYVLPTGEVLRGIARTSLSSSTAPAVEEIVKLGGLLKADAVVTGVLKEYGEIRSGQSTSNVVAVSAQMIETSTGKVVWAGSSTRGGVGFGDRLFGGGGAPLNDVTEDAVDDLLRQLLR